MKPMLPEFPRDSGLTDMTLGLNYKCNSACRFCFIEPDLGQDLADTGWDYIAEVFARNGRGRNFKRLILSGAEATLRKDLARIARLALDRGGFEIVRLQTNGRRMQDAAYCRTLVQAGISEFFVSIHAPTAELDAYLTRSTRSFAEMRAGLRNILASGGRLISNTAVTRDNHRQLPDLARFLLGEGVQESQFWGFVELGDISQRDQHVRLADSVPFLLEALSILREGGVKPVVSWFPECLLGPHAGLLANHASYTLIHENFAKRMDRYGGFDCCHKDHCASFGNSCKGLHQRYVEIFGNERETLKPFQAAPRL